MEIKLTKELKAKAKRISKKDGTSIAAVVRKGLNKLKDTNQ